MTAFRVTYENDCGQRCSQTYRDDIAASRFADALRSIGKANVRMQEVEPGPHEHVEP